MTIFLILAVRGGKKSEKKSFGMDQVQGMNFVYFPESWEKYLELGVWKSARNLPECSKLDFLFLRREKKLSVWPTKQSWVNLSDEGINASTYKNLGALHPCKKCIWVYLGVPNHTRVN